jgi:hypothetical protein
VRSAFALVFMLVVPLLAQDPADIVRRSVERDWTDYGSIRDYTYQQRSEFRRYSSDGQLTSKRSTTNEILILADRPYERPIARDDRPLSGKEARKEQMKLDKEVAKREHESPADRAKEEKERSEDRQFIREIPDAFSFRLLGVETISGLPAWVIEADPKPDYRPVNSRAKSFSKVRAKIWIEQATYHWVKAEAQVMDTLSFGFGLLRIGSGSTLHFEQSHVNNEIWLPSSILVRANGRLALVKKLRVELDVHYSEYKKFQSDAHMVAE